MAPTLYAHPFLSYCWKVLIALWENEVRFDYRRVNDPAAAADWLRLSPTQRMPLLVDNETIVPEATIIIEYLQLHYPGTTPMIPADPSKALEVRKLDRLSDNYLMGPLQTIVSDRIREEKDRDPLGVTQARARLDGAYRWWDQHMRGRPWAADDFGLVECATAPALFYTDWVHPIPRDLVALREYRARLLARPSVARAVNEARPFRALFPYGDPGRD